MHQPERSKSGEHPIVQSYRRKLESIAEADELGRIDAELEAYLADLKSTPPPKR